MIKNPNIAVQLKSIIHSAREATIGAIKTILIREKMTNTNYPLGISDDYLFMPNTDELDPDIIDAVNMKGVVVCNSCDKYEVKFEDLSTDILLEVLSDMEKD